MRQQVQYKRGTTRLLWTQKINANIDYSCHQLHVVGVAKDGGSVGRKNPPPPKS